MTAYEKLFLSVIELLMRFCIKRMPGDSGLSCALFSLEVEMNKAKKGE